MCPLPSTERERHLTAVKKNMCQIQTLFRKEDYWSQVHFYCPVIHLTKQDEKLVLQFFFSYKSTIVYNSFMPWNYRGGLANIFFFQNVFSKTIVQRKDPTKERGSNKRKRVPWSNRFGKSWVLVFMLGYSGSTDIFSKLFMQEIHFLLLSWIPINSSWKIMFKILV